MNDNTNTTPNETAIFRYSEFSDLQALAKFDRQGTWADFVAMIEAPKTYPRKADMPLLVLASFGNVVAPPDPRTGKSSGCVRHAGNVLAITGIEGDHDSGQMSIESAHETLQLFGIRAILHTTARYTPDKPRWRALLPLSRPHAQEERNAFAARVNGLLGGVLAGESFTVSQSFHVGKVEGTSYTALESEGDCIDKVQGLDAGAIGPAKSPVKVDSIDDEMILPPASNETLADLGSALTYLAGKGQADHYPEWVSVGMALKAESRNGRKPELQKLWLEYSRGSNRFAGDEITLRTWERLHGNKTGIAGGVFKKAQDMGWINPATARNPANDPAMSDVLISRKLADMLAGGFLYEHGGRGWLIYDLGVWRACNKGEEVEAGKQMGPLILQEPIKGADDARRAMALASRAMSATGIAAALKLAQSDHRLAVRPDEFDRDPELLNC